MYIDMPFIQPLELSRAFAERLDIVDEFYKTGPLKDMAKNVILNSCHLQGLQEAMGTIQTVQRLYLAAVLGLHNDPKIIEAIQDEQRFPLWQNYVAIDTTEQNKIALARGLYNGDPEKRTPIMLTAADYSRGVAEKIVALAVHDGAEIDVWIDDPTFQRRIYTAGTIETAQEYGKIMAMRREDAQRTIMFNLNTPSFAYPDAAPPKEITKAFNAALSARKKAYSADTFFTATRLPTQKMADIDGIPYDQYVKIFFDMCAVDYNEIGRAHDVLIQKLDAANTIHFANNDGTNLKMSIKGFTFVDSRTAKNVPGSEVYSAPERESANGRLVAMGKFIPPAKSKVVENMTLIFDNGCVIDYHAENGQDILADFLNEDENRRYLGEVALGTNPALRQHVANSMMVEKIGGSFHVALGGSYSIKEYLGKPVSVDNGNRSTGAHWDIATMLYGKDGSILLDDKEYLMQNGLYLPRELSYLNGPK